jgi:hypothetical protein
MAEEEEQMHANAVTALAAIGRANVALCQRWLDFSVRSVEQAHRLSHAAFEVFCERSLAAAQMAAVKTASAVLRGVGGEMSGPVAPGVEVLRLLSRGLPGLVAEYAGDLSPVSESGDA